MPKRLEQALKRRASQLGMETKSDRYRAYVYGTLQKVEAAKKEARKNAK